MIAFLSSAGTCRAGFELRPAQIGFESLIPGRLPGPFDETASTLPPVSWAAGFLHLTPHGMGEISVDAIAVSLQRGGVSWRSALSRTGIPRYSEWVASAALGVRGSTSRWEIEGAELLSAPSPKLGGDDVALHQDRCTVVSCLAGVGLQNWGWLDLNVRDLLRAGPARAYGLEPRPAVSLAVQLAPTISVHSFREWRSHGTRQGVEVRLRPHPMFVLSAGLQAPALRVTAGIQACLGRLASSVWRSRGRDDLPWSAGFAVSAGGQAARAGWSSESSAGASDDSKPVAFAPGLAGRDSLFLDGVDDAPSDSTSEHQGFEAAGGAASAPWRGILASPEVLIGPDSVRAALVDFLDRHWIGGTQMLDTDQIPRSLRPGLLAILPYLPYLPVGRAEVATGRTGSRGQAGPPAANIRGNAETQWFPRRSPRLTQGISLERQDLGFRAVGKIQRSSAEPSLRGWSLVEQGGLSAAAGLGSRFVRWGEGLLRTRALGSDRSSVSPRLAGDAPSALLGWTAGGSSNLHMLFAREGDVAMVAARAGQPNWSAGLLAARRRTSGSAVSLAALWRNGSATSCVEIASEQKAWGAALRCSRVVRLEDLQLEGAVEAREIVSRRDPTRGRFLAPLSRQGMNMAARWSRARVRVTLDRNGEPLSRGPRLPAAASAAKRRDASRMTVDATATLGTGTTWRAGWGESKTSTARQGWATVVSRSVSRRQSLRSALEHDWKAGSASIEVDSRISGSSSGRSAGLFRVSRTDRRGAWALGVIEHHGSTRSVALRQMGWAPKLDEGLWCAGRIRQGVGRSVIDVAVVWPIRSTGEQQPQVCLRTGLELGIPWLLDGHESNLDPNERSPAAD